MTANTLDFLNRNFQILVFIKGKVRVCIKLKLMELFLKLLHLINGSFYSFEMLVQIWIIFQNSVRIFADKYDFKKTIAFAFNV